MLDENKNAIPLDDPFRVQMDFESRKVGRDEINGLVVSTVFLALDHSLGSNEKQLFETMIFNDGVSCDERGDSEGHYMRRYATWNEALRGHKEACTLIAELGKAKDDKSEQI